MLRNLMEEEKQLDFNQPLLSVRRFSSKSNDDDKKKIDKPIPKLPPLPFYKSELKSGPIRNPGTVPFVWEKTPGNPKDKRKSQQPQIPPRPPPGRFSSPKRDAIKKSPRPAIYADTKAWETEKSSAATKEKENKSSSSGSEEVGGDETFVDALDTLSRSESFSMACSVSGVSGLDGLCEAFSLDPQARDFMMGRFLPAAKAMASSDAPQYALRKVSGRPGEVSRAENGNRTRPPNQYQPNDLPMYAQELRAAESDGESDTYDGSDVMSAKLCGLFPRLCFRNSTFLLNPVPGIRVHSQFPARVHANSSPASSCSETKNKHVEDVVCIRTSGRSDSEPKCRSNQIKKKSGSPRLDELSQTRYQQGNDLSSTQKVFSHTKLPELRDYLGLPEKTTNSKCGFEVRKIKLRNFQELLASETSKCGVKSQIPVVEKTLYIDSLHTTKSPSSNSSYSDAKGNSVEVTEKEDTFSLDSSSIQDIKSEKSATLPENLESVDSCSQSSSEKKTDNVPRRDTDLIQDPLASLDSKVTNEESCDSESHFSGKLYDSESKCHDDYNKAITLSCSKPSNNQINFESLEPFEANDHEKSNQISVYEIKEGSPYENFLQMSLTLPSPKSPSQSWLKRALPVASSRSSRSSLAGRIGISSPITSPLDPKWENIVKSSHLHQGHLRFPEEHLAPIPEA